VHEVRECVVGGSLAKEAVELFHVNADRAGASR
jgi:hypothetical protein